MRQSLLCYINIFLIFFFKTLFIVIIIEYRQESLSGEGEWDCNTKFYSTCVHSSLHHSSDYNISVFTLCKTVSLNAI